MLANKHKNRLQGRFSIVDMTKRFYNQSMKKSILSIIMLVVFLFLPLVALAVRIQTYNGVVTKNVAGTLTLEVDRGTLGKVYYTVKPASGAYTVGDTVSFSVNEDVTPSVVVVSSLSKGTNPNANIGVGSKSGNASDYRLFSGISCPDQPLTCFTQAVFKFSQTAILLLAVAVIVIAGIIYMTSSGNPKQLETAKKLIIGALTGVAVMILGRLFLTQVVGVSWPWL